MSTAMRRAWRHVKYTSHDLRAAREQAERRNARTAKAAVEYWSMYESDTVVDPDLAEPSYPRWHDRDFGWKIRYIFGVIVVVFVSFVAILIFGIRGLVHNVEHRECPRKAAAMGVQAQWVEYSFFGWECLANVDGRWVPIDTVHNDTGVWIRGGTP